VLPARDRSAEIARAILQAWRRGDRRRLRSILDRALHSIAAAEAETSLEEERRELLEGVTRELLQSSAEPVSRSNQDSIATCIALLRHLSSEDEPPRASTRGLG
jgi:hypothetical protein